MARRTVRLDVRQGRVLGAQADRLVPGQRRDTMRVGERGAGQADWTRVRGAAPGRRPLSASNVRVEGLDLGGCFPFKSNRCGELREGLRAVSAIGQ